MSEFEDKVKAAAEAAKADFETVVSEGKEVAEEVKAAASGQKLESDVEGAAGYRAEEQGSDGLATAALVLGILSIVGAFVYNWVGMILGIIGIVLGAKARKACQTSKATAGFVCSIIGVILSAIALVCVLACASAVGIASLLG